MLLSDKDFVYESSGKEEEVARKFGKDFSNRWVVASKKVAPVSKEPSATMVVAVSKGNDYT
jgi:hypothetical protein